MISFNLNFLLKGPLSKSVILGVRNSTYESQRVHNLVYNNGSKGKSKSYRRQYKKKKKIVGLLAKENVHSKVENDVMSWKTASESLENKAVIGP